MAGQTRINGNLIDTGTDPEDILSVSSGDNRYPQLSGNNTLTGDLTVGSDGLFVDASTGNVGIGTSSPDIFGRFYTKTVGLSSTGSSVIQINSSSNSGIDFGVSGVRTAGLSIGPSATTLSTLNATPIRFETNTSEAMRIDSSGNVGIGTSSPLKTLHVDSGADISAARFESSGSTTVLLTRDNGLGSGYLQYASGGFNFVQPDPSPMRFYTDNSEAMRIDSSGNVLVGTTDQFPNSVGETAPGISLRADGLIAANRSDGNPLDLSRANSDGNIVQFRKDGSIVGAIGVEQGDLTINADDDIFINVSGNTGGTNPIIRMFGAGGENQVVDVDSKFNPRNDNSYDLGDSSNRWDDIFATNGTIQTSDINEKQDIEELSDTEARVAAKAKTLLRKFRWKSAVEEKGDEARIHFGIIAQDLEQAFIDEGLDAGRYGMFIRGEWYEADRVVPAKDAVYEQQLVEEATYDEEGNELTPAVYEDVLVEKAVEEHTVTDTFETAEEAPEGAVKKERLGVRYHELLAFIIAAI